MPAMPDLIWEHQQTRITLSTQHGGRVVSWTSDGVERVHPVVQYEGGLFRFLFAEEQYPGASFEVPHQVVSWESDAAGFRAHLRHYWNTPGWFMRAAGWPQKANELHADGLLLDKVLTYTHATDTIVCDLTLTNLTGETKYLTPWVHLSFAPWPTEKWVTVAGARQEFNNTEVYWGEHIVPPGTHCAMVMGDPTVPRYFALGGATQHLRGLSGALPIAGEWLQAAAELRYDNITLPPGSQWRANSYVAFSTDSATAGLEPPLELYSEIAPAPSTTAPPDLTALLEHWMLPPETASGLMALSYLDKPPFYAAGRFFAANSFAGFQAQDDKAIAHVMLYASRDLNEVRIELAGGAQGWNLRGNNGEPTSSATLSLVAHDFVPLTLLAPADLSGREAVRVTVTVPGHAPIELIVDAAATVEAPRSYQARQGPAYLEQRYADKLGPAPAADASAVMAWQEKMRGRYRQWLAFNAYGDCDLEPRLLERQVGPTCIREKWTVQTEPGIYVPGYLVRPRAMPPGRRPVIYFLHGSGPGKDGFTGDEETNPVQTMFGHELENMPYFLARELGCLVYVPDGRGQGEMGETDPGRWAARMEALGVNNAALRLHDQIRALDWLVTRDDVDPTRIGSCGCSGGGNLTYTFAAADERVAASIASSTGSARPLNPAPDGWFHRMLLPAGERIDPYGAEPLTGAPMGMLIAPRPLWIVDGLDDLGIAPQDRPAWRATMQQGRDAIRHVYRQLGAEAHYEDSWLEGGHCAGMTHYGVAAWLKTHLNIV